MVFYIFHEIDIKTFLNFLLIIALLTTIYIYIYIYALMDTVKVMINNQFKETSSFYIYNMER